jgi:uncharacterized protein
MGNAIERVCLSVNSVCNLKCTYCYFFNQPELLPGPNSLSAAEIEVILSNIQRYSVRPEVDKRVKVNFVGSGEPLLSWKAIRTALEEFQRKDPSHRLRFYMVTNGMLLTDQVIKEMQSLQLSPSVSLDGPAWLHDRTRVRHNGRGSHADVMRGIDRLRAAGMPVAINATLGRELLNNLDAFLDFVVEQGFNKVIFDRLVDVPDDVAVSTPEFYAALQRIAELKESRNLHHLEIGNLEAYRRAVGGSPDRVCTMFGSTCGAGFHNIIYMQRDVYPCGRMFGQERWKLGRFDEPLELFPQRMAVLVGGRSCSGPAKQEEGLAGPDCLIERQRPDYDHAPREQFVAWFSARLRVAGRPTA